MIRITILTGALAGQTVTIGTDTADGGVIPLEYLGLLALKGTRWEISFDDATAKEIDEWTRADIAARVISALMMGRGVRFRGTRRQLAMTDRVSLLKRAVREITDDIERSGGSVYVVSDKEDDDLILGLRAEGTNPTSD